MDYSIKEVSEKTGLKAHVLRYYEKEGLLPNIQRSGNGSRRYSADDIEWLSLICCLKNTGMSIKQIRDFVQLSLQGNSTLKQRRDMMIAHKGEVEEQIKELQLHLAKVNHKIQYFSSQYEQFIKESENSDYSAS